MVLRQLWRRLVLLPLNRTLPSQNSCWPAVPFRFERNKPDLLPDLNAEGKNKERKKEMELWLRKVEEENCGFKAQVWSRGNHYLR